MHDHTCKCDTCMSCASIFETHRIVGHNKKKLMFGFMTHPQTEKVYGGTEKCTEEEKTSLNHVSSYSRWF